MFKILLQARGSAAEETSGVARQTAQRELGQRELRERSLEAEPGGRRVDTQLGDKSLGEGLRGSGSAGESLRDRQGFGASHRRSELGVGARIGQALESIIGASAPMGEQLNGESTQPLVFPRFERRTRPSTGSNEAGGS